MTTKVTVTNQGPDNVQVMVMERKRGTHRDTGVMPEFWDELKYRHAPLSVGGSQEFYLHDDMRIEVAEVKTIEAMVNIQPRRSKP